MKTISQRNIPTCNFCHDGIPDTKIDIDILDIICMNGNPCEKSDLLFLFILFLRLKVMKNKKDIPQETLWEKTEWDEERFFHCLQQLRKLKLISIKDSK